MRDQNLDSQVFCTELDRICKAVSKDSEVLSRITPRLWDDFENSYCLFEPEAVSLVQLAILSWYIPEKFGILLRMSLEEEITKKEELDFIEYLLQSKVLMKLFLLETSKWSTRDFFGNILQKDCLKRAMRRVSPQMKTKRKPKRSQRVRGYRDKGTLKLSHQIHNCSNQTLEQNELERSRLNRHNTFLLSLGFLGVSGG